MSIRVTAQDYGKYLAVQRSGVTNMFDLKTVELLSGLSKEKLKYIMNHYEELAKTYNK